MEKLIADRIARAIHDRVFPGCVVGILRKNNEQTILPFGRQTYGQDALPIVQDTVYDVASITKSIPTASLALHLIDAGQLHYDDQLIRFLPELTMSYRELITVRHLLTYTLDFPFILSAYKDRSPEEILKRILTAELRTPPGSSFHYMNATAILLGILIERVIGKRLDVYADEVFFKPLGMERTTFHPEIFPRDMIVPTEQDPWRRRLMHGEVHDESAYALRSSIIAGSAGLFSTAPDLLQFLSMLLRGGSLAENQYLSRNRIDEIQTNQLSGIGASVGMGWELNQSQWMGSSVTPHTFGKTGFTGCMVLCNPDYGRALVLLSNTIYPTRPRTREAINQVRRDIADLVFQS